MGCTVHVPACRAAAAAVGDIIGPVTCISVQLTNARLLAAAVAAAAGAAAQFNVTGETLDQVLLPQDLRKIALLKIDVEGFEPHVLAGASQLLQKQLIDNILLEYSPHVIERTK